MRIFLFIILGLVSMAAPANASGKFVDELSFVSPGCEKVGWCTLKEKFGYIDSKGIGWEAQAGNLTDGASIPPDLKPYFGNSFDADLLRAAVIHDHYCGRRVRPWYQTHWVFYDALRASGVNQKRAGLMLLGILLGGPKWIWLTQGEPCGIGRTCIKQLASAKLPSGGAVQLNADGKKLLYRSARYDAPEFLGEVIRAQAALEAVGPDAKPEELLEIAKSIRPQDEFLNGPDEIMLPPPPPGVIDR